MFWGVEGCSFTDVERFFVHELLAQMLHLTKKKVTGLGMHVKSTYYNASIFVLKSSRDLMF